MDYAPDHFWLESFYDLRMGKGLIEHSTDNWLRRVVPFQLPTLTGSGCHLL